MVLAHWDEVETREVDFGHLRGRWQDLGRAAGSVAVGLKRIHVAPGGWSTPAHVHGREEELFYVLGGSGLSWQEGETYELRAGDCLYHAPDGKAHTLHGGDEGLDVLAFGQRLGDEAAYLPRAGVLWLGAHYVLAGPADSRPWAYEREAGPPPLPDTPSARPSSIVRVAELEPLPDEDDPPGYESEWRAPGRVAGATNTGLKHVRVEPGKLNCPHHCHGSEEELFVILEGSATLELMASPQAEPPAPTEHAVRPGHVVSRPAGTGVAHAFRAGPEGLTLLAYGERHPNDIVYYPRSNKLLFAGVGLIARVESLDYWDGEEER